MKVDEIVHYKRSKINFLLKWLFEKIREFTIILVRNLTEEEVSAFISWFYQKEYSGGNYWDIEKSSSAHDLKYKYLANTPCAKNFKLLLGRLFSVISYI